MYFQAVQAEPHMVEAILHHVEGGHFLRNKENGFSLPHRIGDYIGNRLRLSCARRPLNDKARPSSDINYCADLRGIGVGDEHRRLRFHFGMVNVMDLGNCMQISYRRVSIDFPEQLVRLWPRPDWPT